MSPFAERGSPLRLKDRSRPSKDRQRPSGDAIFPRRLEISPEVFRVPATLEGLGVKADGAGDGLGRIVEELDAEMGDASGKEPREVLGGGLRDGVVEGVATADIRLQGVLHPD